MGWIKNLGCLGESKREKLNRTLLRFDPKEETDENKLRLQLAKLAVSHEIIEQLISGWKSRPKLEKRLKLSRRAVLNLIPYMEKENPSKPGFWPTQIEARELFARDELARDQISKNPPTDYQRKRYLLGGTRLNKRDRHYLKKHGFLPPAPTLSNPVVRKAIHEVRRHLIAYIKKIWPISGSNRD